MDRGREFLVKRGYAPKLRAEIVKGRRAVMPGVTDIDVADDDADVDDGHAADIDAMLMLTLLILFLIMFLCS